MIWLTFEIEVEIIVVTFKLILHFFLLICQIFNTHSLNVLLQLHFSIGFH